MSTPHHMHMPLDPMAFLRITEVTVMEWVDTIIANSPPNPKK